MWFVAISVVRSAGSFVEGGLTFCGASDPEALCGMAVVVALFGSVLVKEKLEREGVWG